MTPVGVFLIYPNEDKCHFVNTPLLSRIAKPNRWTEEVANDLEFVHNGVQSWDWFYGKHHNDRHTFQPCFSNSQVREVYDYFQSDAYKTADKITVVVG